MIWHRVLHFLSAVFGLVFLQQERPCENEIHWIMFYNNVSVSKHRYSYELGNLIPLHDYILRWFLSIALCIPTAHDLCVGSVPHMSVCNTQRQKFPSSYARQRNKCLFSLNWRCSGLMVVCLSLDQAVWVWALARDIVLCTWARHLTLAVPPSTQVYKWVPANLMQGGNPAMD